MNAAARLVHQNVLSRHLVLTHLLSRRQMMVLLLAVAILFSALSVIYVTYMNKIMHANYQHVLAEQNQLQVQQSQLLLERSTWMSQVRIQTIAVKKLDMVLPDFQSIVVIRES